MFAFLAEPQNGILCKAGGLPVSKEIPRAKEI
jgi:hypothetical protein